MFKTQANLRWAFVIFCSVSCSTKRGDMEHRIELDTIQFDGLFFASEQLIIRANDSIVFQRDVGTTRAFQSIYGEFIIRKTEAVNLSIQTFLDNRKVIDTSFIIPRDIYLNSIGGSICYPSYISEDSLRRIAEPHFGYIPSDSCKRYITLMPDSVMYKYPYY